MPINRTRLKRNTTETKQPVDSGKAEIHRKVAILAGAMPLQAMTQGLTIAQRELERYEDAVLRGYFGSEEVPLRAVRAYQLLVLLDRWSDLVSKQIAHGRVRPRLHELRVLLASRHCRREARRLLLLLR